MRSRAPCGSQQGTEESTARTAALVVDMDNLKVFNDTLGRDVGDQAIREVAAVIRAACRRGDFVARTGGDEFVVLMEGANAEIALVVADRIHATMYDIHLGEPRLELRVGVSIGIAVVPDDVGAPRELLHAADQAMYDAKFAGGQRTRLASDHGGSPEPRALRGRSIRLADTLIRSLVTGGSAEELAALSLAQRWGGGVIGQLGLSPDLLPQLRLVLASAASRRFEAQRSDREHSLARYLVDRIEEDWEAASGDGVGEQLMFLVRALLDLAWMTMPRPFGAGLSLDDALRSIAPQAADTAAWSALVEVLRKDVVRHRAA